MLNLLYTLVIAETLVKIVASAKLVDECSIYRRKSGQIQIREVTVLENFLSTYSDAWVVNEHRLLKKRQI